MAEDIAAFLRSRLDEREKVALAACGDAGSAGRWRQEDPHREPGRIEDDLNDVVIYDEGSPTGEQARHIADNDPEFVLADVAAKRQIVWEHGDNGVFKHDDNGDLVRAGPLGDRCTSCLLTDDPLAAEAGSEFAEMAPYPCRTLRLLALPFAGHSQYRESWRP